MRASPEYYTGTRLIGCCHYLPQHVVATRSNVFDLRRYLAEASKVMFQFEVFFGARMALPAQNVGCNPMRARPTRLKLVLVRLLGSYEAVVVVTTAPRAEFSRWSSGALPFFQLQGIFLGARLPRFFQDQMVVFLCTAMITVP